MLEAFACRSLDPLPDGVIVRTRSGLVETWQQEPLEMGTPSLQRVSFGWQQPCAEVAIPEPGSRHASAGAVAHSSTRASTNTV